MDLQACTEKISKKLNSQNAFDTTVKIDCGGDGLIYIDGVAKPGVVHHENLDAACTIHLSLENLAALLKRELNPVAALMSGKIKVTGDMSVLMRLQEIV